MTPEERQASIEATATERAATLTPPVKHVTVADLHQRLSAIEGKSSAGDPSNDFHQQSNILRDTHGERRAKFIEHLTLNNVVEQASVPLFIKLLNEYECDGGSDAPYEVCVKSSGIDKSSGLDWTSVPGEGVYYPGDGPVSPRPVPRRMRLTE